MAGSAEYGLGAFTFPRGWFMVADSAEVTSVPLAVRYFGQDLVLYRGESGRAYMVDAYCPHMGAHLAKNTTSYVIHDKRQVEGESIRCPYHAWRFGADGACNDIPYSKAKPPAAAKLRSWPLQERYGCLYTWHDPEGGEPDFDLPAIPEWDNPSYVRWEIDRLGMLPCHPQEIVDNITDVAHLGPTHGGPAEYFNNVISGVEVRQYQGAYHRALAPGVMLETDTFYIGPGILLSYFNGGHAVMYIAHTPVDDGSLKAWHGLLVNSGKPVATDGDVEPARRQQAGSLAALAQDFEIWANKRACITPLAVPGDGAFSKARVWYKQFYNPRAEAEKYQSLANGTYGVRDMPAQRQLVD
ncbi:Rieske 2Fe-2S domain-containing protein [Azospirillum agricola]|uniref:Rieske 2Fe-2S domain-containing protein n=1 Tax=Azospirillum agricola TaxID=1720247 RepID=UPI000A0F2905|nr:Rieske 2Fe-2S domain-containing protein [Azospirillum agricola]SMH37430.1 3-ketosteroid 9alpha-monooxygenase subunit A [Azospirillum lipoferum]